MKFHSELPSCIRLLLLPWVGCVHAIAGTAVLPAPPQHSGEGTPGDWCESFRTLPVLHKDGAHPLLREFRLVGRYQYQAAHLDGRDVDGNDFHEAHDEHRRFRFGARAKFAGHLSSTAVVNLVDDGRRNRRDLDWGYDSFDEASVSFDLAGAFGGGPLDSLQLTFGRTKFELSHEARMSSNRIRTIERSTISNKVYAGARPTGFSLDAGAGRWSWTAALYSAGRDGGDNGFLSDFHGDWIYYAHAGWQVTDALLVNFDAVYNEGGFGGDSVLPYRWALSMNADYNTGRWGVAGDVIVGDNGGAGNGAAGTARQGGFRGLVLMPYFWIVEDRLEGVLRYQYGGASAPQGVRVNNRYGRAAGNDPASLNGGRGDRHHSAYAGLNYHLCGNNAKVMGGVEYQTMRGDAGTRGKFDTLTWLVAFRTFF